MQSEFEMVIGLEVHCQLNTKSKSFCGDENRFGADPNTFISPISLAHPGTLPRLNQAQLSKAVRLGLALKGKINTTSNYDRKNYFYPDLPKGYQITQDQTPIIVGGEFQIADRKIRIHHIHMEEDAGKLIHDLSDEYSMVDLNRAGVPLLEIVTEPDFRTAEEVEYFLEELRALVRWLDVSDGNMEEGSLRCDVNLSLRPIGQEAYGNRCEIKNLNSMRFAKQAIAYEFSRQESLLKEGKKVSQQTLNFDPVTGVTTPLRDKEEAHDYRYFPDPDLPPVVISQAEVESIKKNLPELPGSISQRWLAAYKISEGDSAVLLQSKSRADWADVLFSNSSVPKQLAQFLVNQIIPFAKTINDQPESLKLNPSRMEDFLKMINAEKVSTSIAYQKVFPVWIKNSGADPMEIAKSMDLIQDSDVGNLEAAVQEIVNANPKEAAAFRAGKKKLLGFFMGELMKAQKGKVNPKMANEIIQKVLNQ